ncbi:hypothetical protein ABT124_47250 [Streptomyces sp. NPDC001982]|uniref:hypothetical protein n=1 Tax=Streptomyces sp. NPDC001982 TaxID=3154405 RepID=UPI00332A693C
MRSVLALILSVLLTVRGMRWAETVPTAPVRPLPAPRCQRPADVIETDSLPLVRPYLVAHEQAQERRRQRARRRAAVLAVMGQDYVPTVTA